MNKIGFRIYRFKEGPSVGLTVNEGDWTKKVVDIRDILKLYNSEDESKFAMFMSFSETGTYITIARSISGRGGDNTAAWIYIPNNIEVTGTDIIPIIEVVKEELSASKSNVERLTQIFNKDYRVMELADYMPSSTEKVFAKRDVGFYSLKELIGEKRYQPIYANYHTVLINDNDSMEIVDKNLADLTREKLVETLAFCPPVKQDIPTGVTVHFNTHGYPTFNKPVRVYKSSRINLVFKRSGFEDIPYMDSVEENDQICGVPKFDWKISISKEQFKVKAAHDAVRNLTNDARIYVNNVELSWNRSIQLYEREAINATITISVNGYETFGRNINLLNARFPILVELHRAEREDGWKIELANGYTADMTLRSKHLRGDMHESPLKGYEREDGVLRYSNFGMWKQRIYGFLAALVLLFVVGGCIELYDWYDSHTFTWQLGWPPVKTAKIYNTSYSSSTDDYVTDANNENQTSEDNSTTTGSTTPAINDAIAYLDNEAGVWQRDSLIKYPELEGLFEEMNSYDFSKILNRDSKLRKSKNFKLVYDAIIINQGKSFNGNFCGDKDYTITLQNYIKKLNKTVEPTQTPSNGGVASEAANKAQKTPKATPAKQNSGSNNSSSDQKPLRGEV